MKTIILLFFSLIIFSSVQAQTPEIESLLKKAEITNGKEKIMTIAEISKDFCYIDPQKGIKYGEQALQLAEILKIPSAKSKVYNSLGVNYWAMSDMKTARMYYNKAFRNAVTFKDSIEIALFYNRIGLIYETQGNFDSCYIVFNKELEINKQLKNNDRIGTSLENIGTIHLNRGEFKSALTYLLEAKSIYEKLNNQKKLAFLYLKLGQIYSETKEYGVAEKWFQKGIDLSNANKDNQKLGIGLNALAVVYNYQERYDEALEKEKEALKVFEGVKNITLNQTINGNIGNIYVAQGKYYKAIPYHRKSIDLALKLNNPLAIAGAWYNLGHDYAGLKDYTRARSYYEEALAVYTKTKSRTNLIKNYKSLIGVNDSLKDYSQSVKYYRLYTDAKDSLNKTELNSTLDSLKVKFNTEQTNKENLALVKNEAMQVRTITLQRDMIILAGTFLILLLVLVFVIIRNRVKIMKANEALELKNAEISSKAEELRITNEKISELSKFKDSMNSFLVHDLKNPLNTIINLSPKQVTEHQIEVVQHSGKQMLNIVMNILDINKYENKSMKLSVENISITSIINQAFNDIAYLAEKKSILIKLNYPNDFVVKVDPEIIERVFVNLFSNAIKFSSNGDCIQVVVEATNQNKVKISIKDNGEGICPEHLPFIFEKFTQVQAKNSGVTRSTGIGLTFCKLAVESHSGEIGVDSIAGKGATFWFTLLMAASNQDNLKIPVPNTSPNKSAFHLTGDEKAALLPYCNHLKNLSIYQISDVKKIVQGIEHQDSENIQNWKSGLLNAIADYNETKFQELIKITTDGEF